jgi:hypothetical protein
MKENVISPFDNLFPFELNERLAGFVKSLIEEESQYAADELVELAEELLNQISAVGISYYLKSKLQKEVYNDFLVQLFNSSGHDYNAGPIYRWTANMIKELQNEIPEVHYSFFWKNNQLNEEVHQLALLRNEVMHGFFVLPPDRNIKEANKISELLAQLIEVKWFQQKRNYHFIDHRGFTGQWNITEQSQWNELIGNRPFGKLCERIIQENSDAFWQKDDEIFSEEKCDVPFKLKEYILQNKKGACAVWVHPKDKNADDIYASIGSWLRQQSELLFVGYQLHDQGLTFSSGFLLNRLRVIINTQNNESLKNRKIEELVKKQRSEISEKKIVVLINKIHIALFSPQHVTQLSNFLYENNILLVAVGHHYEHFNRFFNLSISLEHKPKSPSTKEALASLHNYLRFKGPSKERVEEIKDVENLEQILNDVLSELKEKKVLTARRFADSKGYSIEYVHEVFALLHPWVDSSREAFEPDTVDELYGFPSAMTEVTPIYLALGRRDLKLEYQHKVISIN